MPAENPFTYVAVGLVTLLSAALVFVGGKRFAPVAGRRLAGATLLAAGAYLALLILQPRSLIVSNLIVVLVAALLGTVLGRRISSSQALISFVVAAAVADFFSFSDGLTASIIAGYRSGESLLLQYLAVSMPLQGGIVPVVGIGDLIVLGVAFTGLNQLGVSQLAAFAVPVGGLMVALVVGLLGSGIYALPFIAVALVAYLLLASRRASENVLDAPC